MASHLHCRDFKIHTKVGPRDLNWDWETFGYCHDDWLDLNQPQPAHVSIKNACMARIFRSKAKLDVPSLSDLSSPPRQSHIVLWALGLQPVKEKGIMFVCVHMSDSYSGVKVQMHL